MGSFSHRARALALGWLAMLTGAVAVVVVYRIGYEAEAGSRAGAEPAFGGLFMSLPFIAAVAGQFVLVLLAHLVDRVRVVWLMALIVMALLVGQAVGLARLLMT